MLTSTFEHLRPRRIDAAPVEARSSNGFSGPYRNTVLVRPARNGGEESVHRNRRTSPWSTSAMPASPSAHRQKIQFIILRRPFRESGPAASICRLRWPTRRHRARQLFLARNSCCATFSPSSASWPWTAAFGSVKGALSMAMAPPRKAFPSSWFPAAIRL